MKREMRRTGAPPRETTEPRRRYHVPRYVWPAAWDQLSAARAAFATGMVVPSPETGLGRAAPVEVFVAERGAAILERLGAHHVDAGADPWQAHVRKYERLQRAAAIERARHEAAAVGALEAAFQREAERARALQGTGDAS